MGKPELQRFPAICRLPVGRQAECRRETIMSDANVSLLFSGQRIIVEEKMNGTSVKFSADHGRFILLSEDMKVFKPGLTGKYRVPARYSIFDVFDTSKGRFVSFIEKEDVFRSIQRNSLQVDGTNVYNFFLVPILAQGCHFNLDSMPQFLEYFSRYAIDPKMRKPTFMEGVVVKPARELYLVEYEDLVGKLIRNEYLSGKSGIGTNHRRLPTQLNDINPVFGKNDPNFLGRLTDVLRDELGPGNGQK